MTGARIYNLKLNPFSNKNMNMTPGLQENLVAFDENDAGTPTTVKEWKELNYGKEEIKEAHSYMELCRAIPLLDTSPQVIVKVMLENYLEYEASAKQLEEFFGTITWELSSREARTDLPFKHSELSVK